MKEVRGSRWMHLLNQICPALPYGNTSLLIVPSLLEDQTWFELLRGRENHVEMRINHLVRRVLSFGVWWQTNFRSKQWKSLISRIQNAKTLLYRLVGEEKLLHRLQPQLDWYYLDCSIFTQQMEIVSRLYLSSAVGSRLTKKSKERGWGEEKGNLRQKSENCRHQQGYCMCVFAQHFCHFCCCSVCKIWLLFLLLLVVVCYWGAIGIWMKPPKMINYHWYPMHAAVSQHTLPHTYTFNIYCNSVFYSFHSFPCSQLHL